MSKRVKAKVEAVLTVPKTEPILIRWWDAKSVDVNTPKIGLTPKQIDECKDIKPCEMENSGFLVKDTEDYIVLAFEHNISENTFNKFVVIPKRFLISSD